MPDNPAVEAAGTAEVDTKAQENQEVSELDQIKSQLAELSEINAHLSEQVKYHQTEAKKAFENRDKARNELKAIQKDSTKDELAKYVEKLENELKDRDTRLTQIEQESSKRTKLDAVMKVAREKGLKDQYFERLERFIDLDDVNPEKEVSVKLAVEAVKNSYPDLFSTNSVAVDRALPNPKLSATGGDYKAQYEAMLKLPPAERGPDHMARLYELRQLAFPTDYS